MKQQIVAVQRMQDDIQGNMEREISLSDLARAALFSPWYSYRRFFADAGHTDTTYTLCPGRIPCAIAVLKKEVKK